MQSDPVYKKVWKLLYPFADSLVIVPDLNIYIGQYKYIKIGNLVSY